MMLGEYLYLEQSKNKGRAVFTNRALEPDTIVEIAPVIVMSKEERVHLDKTLLHDYIFEWGANKDECCMALGLIPMYNHSFESNCEYYMDMEEALMMVKTVRSISAGEELTINYNGEWNDAKKLWFEAE